MDKLNTSQIRNIWALKITLDINVSWSLVDGNYQVGIYIHLLDLTNKSTTAKNATFSPWQESNLYIYIYISEIYIYLSIYNKVLLLQ